MTTDTLKLDNTVAEIPTGKNIFGIFRKTRLFYLRIVWIRFNQKGIMRVLSDIANLILSVIFIGRKKLISKPLFAQIEPTTRCNLKCRMCVTATPNHKNNNLRFEEFRSVIDKLPSVVCVNIQGNGEPFLNNEILNMINYAARSGKSVFTCTNAMVLDEDKIDAIIESGLFELGISLESANRDKYEYIRRGSDFDKLIYNISRLVRLRDLRNRNLIIKFWVTVMNNNLNEIEDIIRFASELGVDGIYFQRLQHKYDYRLNYAGNFASDPETGLNFTRKQFMRRFGRIAREYGIPVGFSGKCLWPWMGIFINAKGFVTPCCVINDYEKYSPGNILYQDLKNIWNHKSYYAVRSAVAGKNTIQCCQDCSFFGKSG